MELAQQIVLVYVNKKELNTPNFPSYDDLVVSLETNFARMNGGLPGDEVQVWHEKNTNDHTSVRCYVLREGRVSQSYSTRL